MNFLYAYTYACMHTHKHTHIHNTLSHFHLLCIPWGGLIEYLCVCKSRYSIVDSVSLVISIPFCFLVLGQSSSILSVSKVI